jgi:putative flippase GtrA
MAQRSNMYGGVAEASCLGSVWIRDCELVNERSMRNIVHLPPGLASLVTQAGRFGVVGVAATAAHLGIYFCLAEYLHLAPLVANTIAFVLAFCISFMGQAGWTFRDHADSQWITSHRLLRFLIASIAGFASNTLIVAIVVIWCGLPSAYALPFMAILVPAALFLLNRYWVFHPSGRHTNSLLIKEDSRCR